jgi:hypothetical protein
LTKELNPAHKSNQSLGWRADIVELFALTLDNALPRLEQIRRAILVDDFQTIEQQAQYQMLPHS